MVDFGENIKFTKDTGEVLEINQEYVGIKSREDNIMSVNFRVPAQDAQVIKHYFSLFGMIEPLKMDICDTGDRPVFFRGISPILEKNENGKEYSFIALTLQESIKTVDQREEELCHECTGCGIHTNNSEDLGRLI